MTFVWPRRPPPFVLLAISLAVTTMIAERDATAAGPRERLMRKASWTLRIVTLLSLVIILGPIAIVILVSFSPSDFFAFPPPRPLLRWFYRILSGSRACGGPTCESGGCPGCLGSGHGAGHAGRLVPWRAPRAVVGLLNALFLSPLVFRRSSSASRCCCSTAGLACRSCQV